LLQYFSLKLYIFIEWHTPAERIIPFLTASYNAAENFIALPFNFVKAMPGSVCPIIVDMTVKNPT
jgi:hypothetical protein